MKTCKDLSNSRNMAFNMKKLLNYGMDLTLRRRGGKKKCKWNEALLADFCWQKPVSAGEWFNADAFYQELLTQLWSPGS
jgi:hypothetical protein